VNFTLQVRGWLRELGLGHLVEHVGMLATSMDELAEVPPPPCLPACLRTRAPTELQCVGVVEHCATAACRRYACAASRPCPTHPHAITLGPVLTIGLAPTLWGWPVWGEEWVFVL
jgi:hypothetical protein